nr:concanavalin A-like lectin/glucanase, subgroup [Tanacetum cinerariifolium]
MHVSNTDGLTTYMDPAWAGCPVTRRSTIGYCVFLEDNSLSWPAKRQDTLSTLSTQDEYRGPEVDARERLVAERERALEEREKAIRKSEMEAAARVNSMEAHVNSYRRELIARERNITRWEALLLPTQRTALEKERKVLMKEQDVIEREKKLLNLKMKVLYHNENEIKARPNSKCDPGIGRKRKETILINKGGVPRIKVVHGRLGSSVSKQKSLNYENDIVDCDADDSENNDDEFTPYSSDYTSSSPNKTKKIGKESVKCHQCKRRDRNIVVPCTKCKEKVYCIRCIKEWYPQL